MKPDHFRRTKMIASYLADSIRPGDVKRVRTLGADIIRLVYDREKKANLAALLKQIRAESELAIMLDVASWDQAVVVGPQQGIELAVGSTIKAGRPQSKADLEIESPYWETLFADDAQVFLAHGSISLKVSKCTAQWAELEVVVAGVVRPGMALFCPATRPLQEVDEPGAQELAPLMEYGIDHLVISGRHPPSKIHQLRSELAARYRDLSPWLIAKVDSEAIYERIEEILPIVDGIFISRREMALSINPATVPMITKEIMQRANDRACAVVTASEMLSSMRFNITPTRAEVSDVANAVIDGTDAVILSEDVSEGEYGEEAITKMEQVIQDIEAHENVSPNWTRFDPMIENEMDAVAFHAYVTAERVRAKAIVCVTKAGNTAMKLASYRVPLPIIAVTFSEAVNRRLVLARGVEALRVDVDPKLDEVLPVVNDLLVKKSWLRAGDRIVFVAITLSPLGREASNLFTVQTLH